MPANDLDFIPTMATAYEEPVLMGSEAKEGQDQMLKIHKNTYFFNVDVPKASGYYCANTPKGKHKELTAKQCLDSIAEFPHYYEMYGGYACVPFFDFDIKNLTEQELNENKLSWFLCIKSALTQVFPSARLLFADSCGLYDVSGDRQLYKFSFHVVVRDFVYFASNCEIVLYKKLVDLLLDQQDKPEPPKCIKANKSVDQNLSVDSSVYKQDSKGNANLRTLYSAKHYELAQTNNLRIAKPVEFINGELIESKRTTKLFEQFLITNVTGAELQKSEKARVEALLIAVGGEISAEPTRKTEKIEEISLISAFDPSQEARDISLEHMEIDEGQDEKQILKLLKQKMRAIHDGCEFSDQLENDNIITMKFDDTQETPCLICKRAHQGNATFIVYSRQFRTAYYKCHSCRTDGEDKKIKLFGKPPARITKEELQNRVKNYFDIHDKYAWVDFQNEFKGAHFESEQQMLSAVCEKASRVIAVILAGRSCFIKKDGYEKQDFSLIETNKMGACDFEMSYVTTKIDARTKDKKLKQVVEKIKISDFLTHHMPAYGNFTTSPDFNNTDKKLFNLWVSNKAQYSEEKLARNMESVDMLCTVIRDVWAGGNEEYYNYIMSWFAHLVKFPNKKTDICLFIYSVQGCGKSSIVEFIQEYIFGDDHAIVTDLNRIMKQFNSMLEQKLLVCFEEVTQTAHTFVDTFNVLKKVISNKKILIEPKFKEVKNIKDYSNYIALSNHKSWYIEQSDRRMACFHAKPTYRGNREFWQKFNEKTQNQDVGDAFYTYLMKFDCVNLANIPQTELRKELMNMSKSSILGFAEDVKNDILGDEDISQEEKQAYPLAYLYEKYLAWCRETGVEKKLNKNKFSVEIAEIFEKKLDARDHTVFDLTI